MANDQKRKSIPSGDPVAERRPDARRITHPAAPAAGPVFLCLSVLAAFFVPAGTLRAQPATFRVSVSSTGEEARGRSEYLPSVSLDGRYAVFTSSAPNLVAGDDNGVLDVFVRDTVANTTRRASVASDGTEGNADSGTGVQSVSADGRYVVFSSSASNLVVGDDNGRADIFVRDMVANTTSRVSVASDGTQANGDSGGASISADGRYVAFDSGATNLVPDDTNAVPGAVLSGYDVFLHDLDTGATRRVSVASGGGQGNGHSLWPVLSAGGRYVAFGSTASNLVPDDTNAVPGDDFSGYDIFVHDTVENVTRRVSVASGGGQGNGNAAMASISADGRYVAFDSLASNLVPGDTNGKRDVFLHDTVENTTRRVSLATDGAEGNGDCEAVAMSSDGRTIVFGSSASNLVPGDGNQIMDVFLHDSVENTTSRISVATDGTEANWGGYFPNISGDGRYVVFQSWANNLVPGDTNGTGDTFMRGPLAGADSSRYTMADAAAALRAAGGLDAAMDVSRLDLEDEAAGRLDVADAVRIVRKAAGLEPNP